MVVCDQTYQPYRLFNLNDIDLILCCGHSSHTCLSSRYSLWVSKGLLILQAANTHMEMITHMSWIALIRFLSIPMMTVTARIAATATPAVLLVMFLR